MAQPLGPIAGVRTVPVSLTPVMLANYNEHRSMLSIFNDANGPLRMKWGSEPTLTNCTVRMAAGSHYELPSAGGKVFKGPIYGLWESGAGQAYVTEEN